MRWRWVCFRNTRILLASNSSLIYTTRTFCKIIFQKVRKGLGELQGHSQASLHRMRCERRAFVCVDCSRMRLCATPSNKWFNALENLCKHSQLCLKGLNRQDKPHYFLYLKWDPCVNASTSVFQACELWRKVFKHFTIAPGLPYLITYVRICKCIDFKILKSVH